jgi:hypothetical protein
VGGAGTNAWRYAGTGGAQWANYQVDFHLRVDTPSARAGVKWEAENWTWACYRNNVDAPDYEAGLALRRQGDEMYRVMFSLRTQEVALWSSRGGFLQVVPLKLEAGQDYAVRVLAQGPHLKVAVDRRTILDYYEHHGVLTSGGVALGLHEGAASFSQVTIDSLSAFHGTVPPHVADLHFRGWKGGRWAWDGEEPIFLLQDDCIGTELKLVPGWRAQMSDWWHWVNYGDESFYLNKLIEFKSLEEGNRLRFLVVGTDGHDQTKAWLTGRQEVTVTYDPSTDAYVYDTVSDLVIPEGHSLRMNYHLEFTDPTVYGHVGPATPHDSWETPHPWSVYRHVSGKLYKQPHNHAVWYPGWGESDWREAKGGYLAPNGFWALVGDPVANPVWSILGSSVPNSPFHTELCGWAFDVHMCWDLVKVGGTLTPGTYTVKWRLTSVDGKQAGAWLNEATFCAPGDLNKTLLLYTGGIGGKETFSKVVKWASPFYQYPWGDGSLQDTTVGHGDNFSLKLQGPRSAGSVVGGSVYNDPVLANTDYEVSAWVKTKDVRGEGPGLSFGGKSYYPGVTGTHDWQKIGFVCRPGLPLHTVPLSVLNSGSGTVWFDDFMIRPLQPGERPVAPMAAAPQPLPAPAAGGGVILSWDTKSDAQDPGRTLLDQSGCGGHGRLEGKAALADDEGKRVVELDGGEGYVTTDRSYPFTPPQSLSLWVKPGKMVNYSAMIATGGLWNRAWRWSLYKQQSPYSVEFDPWGRRIFADGVVPQDKWTHLGSWTTASSSLCTSMACRSSRRPSAGRSGPWARGRWC